MTTSTKPCWAQRRLPASLAARPPEEVCEIPGSELAERTAALLSLAAATEERSLSQLTLLVASQIPGCTAAVASLWRDGELASQAASHPDAPRLIKVQLDCGRGPVIEAIATDTPITCPDTVNETRWPEFAAAALRMGVRCSVTLTYRGPVVVALTMLGVRPGALSPDQLQLAELLVAYGGALVGAVADYGDSRRTAVQMRDAASGQAIVDQAKGILMHALGCSADEALARMRDVSQRSNIRATEVARRIVAAHSGRQSSAARDELGALAGLARRGRKPPGDVTAQGGSRYRRGDQTAQPSAEPQPRAANAPPGRADRSARQHEPPADAH